MHVQWHLYILSIYNILFSVYVCLYGNKEKRERELAYGKKERKKEIHTKTKFYFDLAHARVTVCMYENG